MRVSLEKANESDAESIFAIQVKAFIPLMEKYQDFNTNPANESIDNVITRINNPNGGFYKIVVGKNMVGAICVYWKGENTQYWISPMFVLPEYQGNGIAQKAIFLVEDMFPQATTWRLATILEEERNCYLYEKMGYIQTNVKRLNDKATLVYYKKLLLHMGSAVMIRTATEKDVEDLAKLMGELGYPTTIKEMELRFNKISSNALYHTIVAEMDGVIVGMIGMFVGFGYEKNEDYIRIVALVVDSKYRKQGIGGELIQGAEEWAMKKAVKKLALNSGNRTERDGAHKFYTNKGFEGNATGFYKELD